MIEKLIEFICNNGGTYQLIEPIDIGGHAITHLVFIDGDLQFWHNNPWDEFCISKEILLTDEQLSIVCEKVFSTAK